MVWKDVSVGFTVAGIIAAFVPPSFFQTLFIGSGSSDPAFWQVLSQAAVGPVAAFFTFIGSMGNIPLAAVLFSNGVSFAGVMAFIFSDLVVFPVLRIQAEYYGWKMAAYILGIFLVILIASAVTMHYGFALFDALPSAESAQSITDRSFFKINYSFFFNLAFIGVSGAFFGWSFKGERGAGSERSVTEWVLLTLSVICYLWLVGGLVVKFFVTFGRS